jgi:hypothetical protein
LKVDMMITKDNHRKKRRGTVIIRETNKSCIDIKRSNAYKTLTMITLLTIGMLSNLC